LLPFYSAAKKKLFSGGKNIGGAFAPLPPPPPNYTCEKSLKCGDEH